mmetsp:Transcript_116923/g.203501  ORF Transcript_116923/g.203501 Transcript_116923/m.203501 type:complete len:318 (-) Transcript_116923:666-1619(-)
MHHHLPREPVGHEPHRDRAPTGHVAEQKDIVPVADLEVIVPVGRIWHVGDLKGVDVHVQRVSIGATDRKLVQLPHLHGAHRRPVPHRVPSGVDGAVRHAIALTVPRDPALAPLEADLDAIGRVDGHGRDGVPEVRQVARAAGHPLRQIRRDGTVPLGDGQLQQVDLHHPNPRGARTGSSTTGWRTLLQGTATALWAGARGGGGRSGAKHGSAGVAGARTGNGHIGARTGLQVHPQDIPGDLVQVHTILRHQLQYAACPILGIDGDLQPLLHRGVDHAKPVPFAPLHRHGGAQLPVHQEYVGVAACVCGLGGCVLEQT